MKFGQRFHAFVVPDWEAYYVDYVRFKAVIKQLACHDDASGQANLVSAIESNFKTVGEFYNQQHDLIVKGIEELRDCYGLPTSPRRYQGVDRCELRAVQAWVQELETSWVQLDWYLRVNDEAVHKLCQKLGRLNGSLQPAGSGLKAQWSELRKGLEGLSDQRSILAETMAYVTTALREPTEHRVDKCSLRLSHLESRFPAFSAIGQLMYEAIKSNSTVVVQDLLDTRAFRELRSDGGLKVIYGSIVDLALLLAATEVVQLLLARQEAITGSQLETDDFLRWIKVVGRKELVAGTDPLRTGAAQQNHDTIAAAVLETFWQGLDRSAQDTAGLVAHIDGFGRSSVHYMARYGPASALRRTIKITCQEPQTTMRLINVLLARDAMGHTPLSYAIIADHADIVELIIDVLSEHAEAGKDSASADLIESLTEHLRLAIKLQRDQAVLRLLSSKSVDLGHRGSHGDTPLVLACRMAREDYVKSILAAMSAMKRDGDIDAPESNSEWTALFVAARAGHVGIVRRLLDSGANQSILDHQGWTAQEHAAIKGHLHVAELLAVDGPLDMSDGPAKAGRHRRGDAPREPLSSHCLILINLGATRRGWDIAAVDLDGASSEISPRHKNRATYTLEASVFGAVGGSQCIKLPILHDTINEPFEFSVNETQSSPLRATFKVLRDATREETSRPICSGTCLLEDPNLRFGEKRQSMIRMHTVPMLDHDDSSNMLGTVTFTYTIARPYVETPIPTPMELTLSRGDGPMRLMGHRGLGMNIQAGGYLQLGENTVQSFLSAAQLGAWGVEFDVQITRDREAVIYHDYSLSETGTDIPVHDLSLAQFTYASEMQSPDGDPNPRGGAEEGGGDVSEANGSIVRNKPRSWSVAKEHEASVHARNRMRHTLGFKNKGFVSNTRDGFIQESFTTLDELLVKLPESVAFDIEFKYPRLHEALSANLSPIAIELNTFVDTALSRIFRSHSASSSSPSSSSKPRRPIFLSSFTPEVCILLAAKQTAYPVLFITSAGKLPAVDAEVRAASPQAAVRFARRWRLAGVVFLADALLLCPRLVRYVQSAGLVCASYGQLNNVPENVKAQDKAGLDIIIGDRVGLIASALGQLPN